MVCVHVCVHMCVCVCVCVCVCACMCVCGGGGHVCVLHARVCVCVCVYVRREKLTVYKIDASTTLCGNSMCVHCGCVWC